MSSKPSPTFHRGGGNCVLRAASRNFGRFQNMFMTYTFQTSTTNISQAPYPLLTLAASGAFSPGMNKIHL
ncbi:hypothetical protein SRHO_G00238400 [Serrasalmus rhombeus]